jgi:endo-1,4-beta-mannosidase
MVNPGTYLLRTDVRDLHEAKQHILKVSSEEESSIDFSDDSVNDEASTVWRDEFGSKVTRWRN